MDASEERNGETGATHSTCPLEIYTDLFMLTHEMTYDRTESKSAKIHIRKPESSFKILRNSTSDYNDI